MNLEADHDNLWKEIQESNARQAEKIKPHEQFKTLPDGNYNGIVSILYNKVANPESPNFGLPKYEIKLTVTLGEFKDKAAFHNRLLFPQYLGDKPKDDDLAELAAWKEKAISYLQKTNEILQNCGVDTSETDKEKFLSNIGLNNERKPEVNFTMKNGVSYINYLVKKETVKVEPGLFDKNNLPTGNDAPL